MTPASGTAPGVRARSGRGGVGRPRRASTAGGARLGAVVAVALLAGAGAAPGERSLPALPVAPLPSGQVVQALDTQIEVQPDGRIWLVLRYLAPRIARGGGDLGYDDVSADLDALCDGPGRGAARALTATGGQVDQVVIVLTDRATPWGASDPQATSFIAAYRAGPEGCEWQ